MSETFGKVRHSVCRWCYGDLPLDDLCRVGKELGLESIELLDPADFATVQAHDLHCAMVSFPTGELADGTVVGRIEKAFNRIEHHEVLVEIYEPLLRQAAEAGFRQVICFSGNREGMDAEQGMKNCAAGLRRLLPLAEKLGVTLVMELLNSKVEHPDYMCDHSDWGVALCEELDSDHFRLLYDIYHMQVMEGDVIATIGRHHPWFSHYHTAGVPGRHEIDATQELNYPAIVRAIEATGYTGYLGQEFTAVRQDPVEALREAVRLCTV